MTTFVGDLPAPPERPRRLPAGFATLCVVLGVYLAVNFVTATRSPTVWADEVLFSDPAINYLQGRGFTSSAWQLQTANETFVGNCPLHTFILIPWLKVFGISPQSVRSINYLYAAATAMLVWLALRRPGIGVSTGRATVIAAVMLCTYGATFAYRSGRYDGLGMFLCALAFYFSTSERRRERMAAIVPCMLMPLTGLYLLPYVAIVATMSIVITRRHWLERMLVVGVGFAAGIGLLYLVITSLGSWETFIASARHNSMLGDLPKSLIDRIVMAVVPPFRPINVPSLLALATAAVLALLMRQPWRPLVFALTAGYVYLSAVVFSRGQVPVYYFWMPEWLLLIAVVATWPGGGRTEAAKPYVSTPFARWAIAGLVFAAAVPGLPARLAIAIMQWRDRDPAIATKLLENRIGLGDVAYVDWRAYYPARFSGAAIHFEYHDMALTPADRAATNVLIISPERLGVMEERYGGGWREVARVRPSDSSKHANLTLAPLYDLAIYRRFEDDPRREER